MQRLKKKYIKPNEVWGSTNVAIKMACQNNDVLRKWILCIKRRGVINVFFSWSDNFKYNEPVNYLRKIYIQSQRLRLQSSQWLNDKNTENTCFPFFLCRPWKNRPCVTHGKSKTEWKSRRRSRNAQRKVTYFGSTVKRSRAEVIAQR